MVGPQCPDIWSNIILDVSVRIFLDETNIYICGFWINQMVLHNVGWCPQSGECLMRTKGLSFLKPEGPFAEAANGLHTWAASLALLWFANLPNLVQIIRSTLQNLNLPHTSYWFPFLQRTLTTAINNPKHPVGLLYHQLVFKENLSYGTVRSLVVQSNHFQQLKSQALEPEICGVNPQLPNQWPICLPVENDQRPKTGMPCGRLPCHRWG